MPAARGFHVVFPGGVSQGPILAGAHDPLGAVRLRRAGHEQLVNVRFAVGRADHLGLRVSSGHFVSLLEGRDPAVAFFLFQRPGAALRLVQRLPQRWTLLAGPGRSRNRAQGRAVRRKAVHQMQQRPQPAALVEWTGPLHLCVRPGKIDLRRILGQNHDSLSGDAALRRLLMRLQNVIERHLLVVKQPIRRFHLGAPPASRRNTGRGMRRQLREHLAQTIIQSFVLQIHLLHFLNHPRRKHGVTPLTPFAPLR